MAEKRKAKDVTLEDRIAALEAGAIKTSNTGRRLSATLQDIQQKLVFSMGAALLVRVNDVVEGGKVRQRVGLIVEAPEDATDPWKPSPCRVQVFTDGERPSQVDAIRDFGEDITYALGTVVASTFAATVRFSIAGEKTESEEGEVDLSLIHI